MHDQGRVAVILKGPQLQSLRKWLFTKASLEVKPANITMPSLAIAPHAESPSPSSPSFQNRKLGRISSGTSHIDKLAPPHPCLWADRVSLMMLVQSSLSCVQKKAPITGQHIYVDGGLSLALFWNIHRLNC